MSTAVVDHEISDSDKISPCHDAYFAPDPKKYCDLQALSYSPMVAVLPDYCNTLFDCACLFGNTSLACMYGWDFARSCEYWAADKPLTDEEREKTLLGRRIHIIGLDGSPKAVEYSKRMNIIDQGIVQNFEHEMSAETGAGLEKADTWVMQQCLSYMPLDHLHTWMKAFLKDRSRPKRFIYDFNPYFDTTRDMTPQALLKDVPGWKLAFEKFYAYRQKTEEEYEVSKVNDRGMCVHHYVVDFEPL
eukprot:CAMPEP_0170396040 /NCGR_PEP_ID=MMETSP0117_2-20130122/22101_1 /TAXON_ID=400756 /ORGANISM="Durinskia baltica, Strain CSIRO CS-38" /LENGTH=244 /DNA_ID=CAMNT_0010652393 /DNA_START=63 /DNA_END=797 /DNA_ORIENTATION=-